MKRKESTDNPISPKKTKHSIDDSPEMVPEYIIDGHLRRVVPYNFVYKSSVKQRWLGRSIYDVFSSEFKDRTSEYYKWAIENAKITVNNEQVDPEFVLGNKDIIRHTIHRHEPPVSSEKIEIVHHSPASLLVVNKPASIPVHGSGRYNFNTLVNILKEEYGFKQDLIHPVNRIDRLTSGIVFFSLSTKDAQSMFHIFNDRQIQKTYLCRVKGDFPFTEPYTCDEPIKTVDHKLTLNQVHPDGKECKTVFRKLSFNGRTSLVECLPLTGRSHQIRVHLQHLGYPIANDPLYYKAWCEQQGRSILKRNTQEDPITATGETTFDCQDCKHPHKDPITQSMSIYLHAKKYEITTSRQDTQLHPDIPLVFETKVLPEWANDTYQGDEELLDTFWKNGGVW